MTETERMIVTSVGVPMMLVLILLVSWCVSMIARAYDMLRDEEKKKVYISTTKRNKVYRSVSYVYLTKE